MVWLRGILSDIWDAAEENIIVITGAENLTACYVSKKQRNIKMGLSSGIPVQ